MEQNSQPIWISHRGLCENATENTLRSFRAAVDVGFTWLEIDLRPTKDGHIALFHDPSTKRIIGLDNQVIDMTRSELENIELPNQCRVLFLDRFLQEFSSCHYVFDIKPDQGRKTISLLIEFLTENQCLEDVIQRTTFLIWNNNQEKYFASLLNSPYSIYARKGECVRAGLSILGHMPFLGGIVDNRTYSIMPKVLGVGMLNRKIVQEYHRRGAKVLAFLPETEEEMIAARRAGVDQILTNYRPI